MPPRPRFLSESRLTRPVVSLAAVGIFLFALTDRLRAADDWTVAGSNLMDLTVLQNEIPEFSFETRVMGPRWSSKAYLEWNHQATPKVERHNKRVYDNPQAALYTNFYDFPDKPLHHFALRQEVTAPRPDTVRLRYSVTPGEELTLGLPGPSKTLTIGPVLAHTPYFEKGSCTVTQADGQVTETPLPAGQKGYPATTHVTLKTAAGEAIEITCDPPLMLHADAAELRFFAGNDHPQPAGKPYRQDITITFPRHVKFEPANRLVDKSSWFPVAIEQANDTRRPSFLPRRGWDDKPAGLHGRILMQDDKMVFEKTGEPIKLWGTNVLRSEGDCSEGYLRESAALMEKYGMNMARFHAFAKPNRKNLWAHMLKILDEHDAMRFDDGQIGLLDFGFAELKKRGIYTKFSVNYGWYPTDACWGRMLNAEDARQLLERGSFYHKHALMPDVQDMLIQCHVNLLNHVNPHTGLRYADDPALAIVELQNEENIFLQLHSHEQQLEKAPAYKKLFYQRFANWLEVRYGGQEGLAAAWGDGLRPGESLQDANISPFPGWISGGTKPTRRQADQYHFFYSVQLDFYQRWEKAVRATGYKGMLVASGWQAADWIGHLYNLLADRSVGIIDRHNYNVINLRAPGLGLLSVGFQNVGDRPFSFSEWSGGSRPGERLDVSQVALYGMGLQGWDASMQFGWGHPGMLPHSSFSVNTSCNEFPILAQFPALSRVVIRQDVEEGATVGRRRVSIPALKETGDVGFSEQFSLLGAANRKSFNAALPSASLAAGRVVMDFVDGPTGQPVVDESARFHDPVARVVRASTGQLAWNYGQGYVTFDTTGSLGYIGFAGGHTLDFHQATLKPKTRMAAVYFTAAGPKETLGNAKSILITTVARGVNKSDLIDDLSSSELHVPPWNAKIEDRIPLLAEPVDVEVEWRGMAPNRIVALDHGGSLPESPVVIPFEKSPGGIRFHLNGSETKTFYYLMECD